MVIPYPLGTQACVSPDLLTHLGTIENISDLFHGETFGFLETEPGIDEKEDLQCHEKEIVSPSWRVSSVPVQVSSQLTDSFDIDGVDILVVRHSDRLYGRIDSNTFRSKHGR
jgi:hypothetical protein